MSDDKLAAGEASVAIPSTAALAFSALTLIVGVLALAVYVAYDLIPRALDTTPLDWVKSTSLLFASVAALLFAALRVPGQVGALEDDAEAETEEAERSTKLYGIYLVGVGFALLLQAVVCSIVFAGVGRSFGRLVGSAGARASANAPPPSIPASLEGLARLFGHSSDDAFAVVGVFALSSLVAVLGALFFFANSIYQKMDEPEKDPFDRRVFWGGLWFRIGEAVLFNLVFFLVFRYYAQQNSVLLPLVSLLVGMFLKTGESLVSGIAGRLFASIQALVPADLGAQKSMKLFAFTVTAFVPALGPVDEKLQEAAALIKTMAGVEQVDADARALSMRVEYDAAKVTPDDIRRKVELKGLRATPVDPAAT